MKLVKKFIIRQLVFTWNDDCNDKEMLQVVYYKPYTNTGYISFGTEQEAVEFCEQYNLKDVVILPFWEKE